MDIVFALMGLVLTLGGIFHGARRLAFLLLLLVITVMRAAALRHDSEPASFRVASGTVPTSMQNGGTLTHAER